jgi:hypothetical protein
MVDSFSYSSRYAINLRKLQHRVEASPLQFRCYSSNGDLITGWSQCFGSLRRYGYFDSFPISHNPMLIINTDLHFNTDVKLIDATDYQILSLQKCCEENEITIMVFWAAWTGYYNKRMLEEIDQFVIRNSQHKIGVILVNTTT